MIFNLTFYFCWCVASLKLYHIGVFVLWIRESMQRHILCAIPLYLSIFLRGQADKRGSKHQIASQHMGGLLSIPYFTLPDPKAELVS